MLTQWIRLIKNSSDVSLDNQGSGTVSMDGTVSLYLGKRIPFNNFFMWLDTVNSNSVSMTIEYWGGSDWTSTVDLLDDTEGMTKTGVVQFSPNKKVRWSVVSDTSDGNAPSELSSFTIYDLYWLKITFSGALSAGTLLQQLTYKFTTQEEVEIKDNDISEFLTSFGQTDWLPQILNASIEVAQDFKKKKLIIDEGQILRFDDVFILTAYKTLFIIYLNLGDSYKERRKEIADLYEKAWTGVYTLDKNNDGVVSSSEMSVSSNRMER